MDALDLARWQFGIITVYHFLFVPITIGLSAIVAGFETAWVRTQNPQWLRLTKFFGKLFLINFAIGVVTGIVQEFQFGMNWSDYSRFVGDVFGAPLAVEGLLAFFLESTFLGLWIFGWDRLLAEACTRPASGSCTSARCSRRTSSWPRTPGCSTRSATPTTRQTGRAELDRLLRGAVQQGPARDVPARRAVGVHDRWRLRARCRAVEHATHRRRRRRTTFRRSGPARRLGRCWSPASASPSPATSQGKIMTEVQPMKMAAAEALYDTQTHAPFSIFTIGSLNGEEHKCDHRGPRPAVLPRPPAASTARSRASTSCAPSTRRRTARTPAQAYYSPGNYTPIIPVTYWTLPAA